MTIADREALERVQEHAIKINAATYSSAMAYTNLIIIAGYGAMFTVWSFTKAFLSPWIAQTAAILLIVSIGIFIGFEVFKMWSAARSMMSFTRTIGSGTTPHGFMAALTAHQTRDQRRAVMLTRVWVPVLVACLVTGYGAGLLLVGNFVCNLFGI